MAVDQPHFLTISCGVALGDRAFALTKRFHLRTRELNTSLEPLLDEIIESCPTVFGHDLLLVERLRKRLGHEA
jgi:hypothetical protein